MVVDVAPVVVVGVDGDLPGETSQEDGRDARLRMSLVGTGLAWP